VSTRNDVHGEPAVALGSDLLGTIGLLLCGQGLAAGCVLAIAFLATWLAWSLVALMMVAGLALCAQVGSARRA
jgi:hypothetical protein